MSKHVRQFLEDNNILCPFQHGFRSGLSTVTKLGQTIHDFATSLDACQQADVLCIDCAKALDKASHDKLLSKLRSLGVCTQLLEWIRAYLSHRQQAVKYKSSVSNNLDVYSGVPQKSMLELLLFLIYINDIA